MILSSLVAYYEQMQRDHPGRIARPGWCTRNVGFVAEISPEGELLNIIPSEQKKGWERLVPAQATRTAGVTAYFLCDTPTYMMGIDTKENPKRTRECFEAARHLHHEVLDGLESPIARGVLAFFDHWDPKTATENPIVLKSGEPLLKDMPLVFAIMQDNYAIEVQNDFAIQTAWERYVTSSENDDLPPMRCLVTGELTPIIRLHPVIKGIPKTKPTTSLISFDKDTPAFSSYGHDGEQGRNAPVGEKAAQAYGAALNYLLASPNHHTRLGDTTIVYWAGRNDEKNSEAFGFSFCGISFGNQQADAQETVQKELDTLMEALVQGKSLPIDIDMDAPFYVLGISPNAARLSVRFFLRDSLGEFLKNIAAHYERLSIVHAPYEPEFLFPYQLLKGVENPNAKNPAASAILTASLMRSILENTRYPEALYTHALLRTRSTQDNDERHTRKNAYSRMAIVKAYLIQNCGYSKEDTTVSLNPERTDTAYLLGRAFAILEQIQQQANDVVTIVNRYQNAACSTPATVFPTLLKLSTAHLAKIQRKNPGLARYLNNQLSDILDSVDTFPNRLDAKEQGDFLLGRYHQNAKRFEKKSSTALDLEKAIEK